MSRSPVMYKCEECKMVGPLEWFQNECRPGWTHGVLTEQNGVEMTTTPEPEMAISYDCEDCGARWPAYSTLLPTGHALSKRHRVFRNTSEMFVDGSKTQAK